MPCYVHTIFQGRLYRIFDLFTHLDHTMVISQISLMLLRNFVYILLTCHWFACIFYFVARVEDYNAGMGEGLSLDWISVNGTSAGNSTNPIAPTSWVSRHEERFIGQPTGVFYLYSMYISIICFAGLGDGDL